MQHNVLDVAHGNDGVQKILTGPHWKHNVSIQSPPQTSLNTTDGTSASRLAVQAFISVTVTVYLLQGIVPVMVFVVAPVDHK